VLFGKREKATLLYVLYKRLDAKGRLTLMERLEFEGRQPNGCTARTLSMSGLREWKGYCVYLGEFIIVECRCAAVRCHKCGEIICHLPLSV
jgi:hypothetical protein